jgi:hypothetical protein
VQRICAVKESAAIIAHLRAADSWGVPQIQALVESTYFAGLRKAGVPES